MKQIFTITFLLLTVSFVRAQESFSFKVLVLPNTTYTSEMSIYTLTETGITTGQPLESSLKKNSLIENTIKVISIMEAKGRKDNGNIPIEIRYTDATSSTLLNGKEQKMDLPITSNIIQVQYTPDDRYVLDSITGEMFNPQVKQLITNMLDQTQQQVEFPEKPLKIGDSFTTEMPMNITSTGMMPINSSITTTYILKEVKEGTAVLSFDQKVSLESKQESVSWEVKGEGSGICKYDIAGQYLSYCKTELPMQTTVKMNENMSSISSTTTISEIKTTAE